MTFEQFVTFLPTTDLEQTSRFYEQTLGLACVRDQGVCRIFKVSEQAYLGFCTHLPELPRNDSLIATLVTDDVQDWYERIKGSVEIVKPPAHNPKYAITHFFFRDCHGYLLEIQRFDLPLE